MNRTACAAAFVVGLVVVGWVGYGYLGGSPLALTMTALIAAVYVAGATEMLRFQRATAALQRALADIPPQLADPAAWIATLPPTLRNAVRLRLEGERVALPGPTVTPYLIGLLVLLGMLGTFLGMVVTLNGAVVALESTTDLQTIRAALAAPVKGLGVAFGTSVAGVAASAMLGLITTLCRRARQQAAHLLDARIATALRPFSRAHQRDEGFKAMQQQARLLPELVDALGTLMAQLERRSGEAEQRLAAEQARFHREAREAYSELAAAVGRSLQASLSESARLAGETIKPVVDTTMAGIARETAALQARVADAVQAQLDGAGARFDSAVTRVTASWTAALEQHQRANAAVGAQIEAALGAHAERVDQHSAALLASVAQAHDALRGELATTAARLTDDTAALHARLAAGTERHLDGLATRFDAAVSAVSETWTRALAEHERSGSVLIERLDGALGAFAGRFDDRAGALLAEVAERSASLQAALASQEEARLAAQRAALAELAGSLQQRWAEAGADSEARQQRICQTLDDTARALVAETKAQASGTLAEVGALMERAAEAPRAAAEVIGELRKELSASVARDNELLAERSRIMETLRALLDAINHASTEQRSAIDALVASSAAALEQAGTRFGDTVATESSRMADAAGLLAGGAAEVASLGEAFQLALRLFGESNTQLMESLQRIEGALDKSMARSDEQLAYYVAQAREIIDLSIGSQQQIVDDLRRLSAPALAGGV
ncbi:DUF802 domain-containing protein [Azoarcus olearius]|uniref:Conserved hypothetical membrane protein n=1 Tax=Azoarcus sp. (strain BH72) TaxID=418699 RepID=A1K242_AZOSB|nr:DUF802 domain-containing protein [Azoarcus olearius]CAL92897.1 conserved hypothetical membrane protein [Azoarcus olearius]